MFNSSKKLSTCFDVVIVGAGPAGIAAALSAAELGAKVFLAEKRGIIGGCLTVGHVTTLMGRCNKNTMADKIGSYVSACGKNTDSGVDVEYTKIRLMELIDKENVTLFLDATLALVNKTENAIKSVVFATQSGLIEVEGKVFIDATGDGVLAYLSGEKIEIGRDEDGLMQPVSVMFTIGGIADWQDLICKHEEMDTPLKKGNFLQLCKDACASGELPSTINIVRLYKCDRSGERMVNATQVNGVPCLTPDDYAKAQKMLRKQMQQVVDFLKNNVEGYENIYIKDSADNVGVRESRRVVGLYTLTTDDMLYGKPFEDVIVHKAHFPIDIHNPSGAGQSETVGRPHSVVPYDIPYRCVVPTVNQNLFTAGRCISGTHRAHASYRVMNTCMSIGEAVGVCAVLCARENVANRDFDYKKAQKILLDRGITLFE